MEAYTGFAEVYDIFMDETPYHAWAERIREMIERYGVSRPGSAPQAGEKTGEASEESPSRQELLQSERDLVVDLGCGTGTLTRLLSDYGYDMIGVDNSQDMLAIALEKEKDTKRPVMYLLQDMQELELYSTVGTVVSVCDSLNYLLTEEEVLQTFQKVNLYLFPRGIFVFDFNTVYKYEKVIGDTTIAENREDCSFIWENYYDPGERINEYDLTLFIREGDLYRKQTETHYQRGYTLSEMKKMAEKAGMEWILAIDADTGKKVHAKTERIFAVVRERIKEIQ